MSQKTSIEFRRMLALMILIVCDTNYSQQVGLCPWEMMLLYQIKQALRAYFSACMALTELDGKVKRKILPYLNGNLCYDAKKKTLLFSLLLEVLQFEKEENLMTNFIWLILKCYCSIIYVLLILNNCLKFHRS